MKPLLLILSFTIFLGSLIPSLDVSQFNRLIELRNHYLKHVEEGKAESDEFLEFIWLHYVSTKDCQEPTHEEDHKKLPLSSLDLNQSLTLFIDLPHKDLPAHTAFVHQEAETYYLLPKGYPSLVFHPPI